MITRKLVDEELVSVPWTFARSGAPGSVAAAGSHKRTDPDIEMVLGMADGDACWDIVC